jgi:hypothetical protein
MSFLRKLFKRGDDEEAEDDGSPIVLDSAAYGPRLLRLEKALDAVAAEMRADQSMDNPGWRGRVNEYSQLAGECMLLRRSSPLTKEAVLDVVFSVRPVFSGPIPTGLEAVGPLQEEMVAAAEELRKSP